jgi:gluconolactonase
VVVAANKPKTLGTIERLDPALDKLVPADARLEILASGFIWTEGPVWIKDGGFLAFSDIPNNVVYKWDGKQITPHVKPSGYTGKKPRGGRPGDEPGSNGLMLDAQGRLTLCEHGDRQVTRIEKNGKKTVLADKYIGKRLNSPNDLVYHSNGDLYFTDPPYGMEKGWDDPARELDFCGVYRLKTDGTLTLLTKEMTRPNGITFSPDEKTLYVANSDPDIAIWKAFPVRTDGTLGAGKVFFDSTPWVGKKKGLPDGMKVDQAGNLFATGPGGVLIFSPAGKHLGTIATGVNTANCAFGEDGMTLFVAADHDICRIRLSTKGRGF